MFPLDPFSVFHSDDTYSTRLLCVPLVYNFWYMLPTHVPYIYDGICRSMPHDCVLDGHTRYTSPHHVPHIDTPELVIACLPDDMQHNILAVRVSASYSYHILACDVYDKT